MYDNAQTYRTKLALSNFLLELLVLIAVLHSKSVSTTLQGDCAQKLSTYIRTYKGTYKKEQYESGQEDGKEAQDKEPHNNGDSNYPSSNDSGAAYKEEQRENSVQLILQSREYSLVQFGY